MTCERAKTLKIYESNGDLGSALSYEFLGFFRNRIGNVVCDDDGDRDRIVDELAGVVGGIECDLRQQGNYAITAAFRCAFDFDDQLLARPRGDQLRRRMLFGQLMQNFPTVLTEQLGNEQPELTRVVDRWLWVVHRITTAMVIIMALLINTAMIYTERVRVNLVYRTIANGTPRSSRRLSFFVWSAVVAIMSWPFKQCEHLRTMTLASEPPDPPPEEAHTVGKTALAVERFDRLPGRRRVHMEDFAQVFALYPLGQVQNRSYANIASTLWAETGQETTYEFAKRVVFSVVMGNADMHLKNWSLLYPEGRTPVWSPAYDLVSIVPYLPNDTLGLNFGDSRQKQILGVAMAVQKQ
jgi:hypothetical protein